MCVRFWILGRAQQLHIIYKKSFYPAAHKIPYLPHKTHSIFTHFFLSKIIYGKIQNLTEISTNYELGLSGTQALHFYGFK